VRLIHERSNTEVELQELFNLADRTRHGPSVLYTQRQQDMCIDNSNFSKFAEVMTSRYSNKMLGSIDIVSAVHSPYWPVEATEWITRIRPNGFPSKSVIKQVVR